MRAADIFNKIINWKKKKQNTGKMIDRYQEEPVEIHKALDALINIKDNPKPISLQMERIDAIKSNVMSQSQLAARSYKKSEGKKEIIGKIKDKIKAEDIKREKVQKEYIKHYSGYFSNLKAVQFEIKPRVISKITAYKGNILRQFKEVYKNERE